MGEPNRNACGCLRLDEENVMIFQASKVHKILHKWMNMWFGWWFSYRKNHWILQWSFFFAGVLFLCAQIASFFGAGFLRDTIYSWFSKSIIQRKNKKVHKGRCVLNLNWWWMMVIVVEKMISPKGYHDLTKIRGNKKTLHDAQHTASCTHVIGQVDSLARPSLGG